MIVCLYGRPLRPFLETALRDLIESTAASGQEMLPLAVEDAPARRGRLAEVEKLYCLPFDPPPGSSSSAIAQELFPHALPITSFAAQDLCWDKLGTTSRLIERGVPVPETLVTSDAQELLDFVKRYEPVMLKERFSCGGHGHLVVWRDGNDLRGDCGSHEYHVQPARVGRRQIEDRVLSYPAPFFAQRMVGTVQARRFVPGQVLRAYVIDNEVRFWTERYRDLYTRPSDWIVTTALGAKYKFVLSVSDEIKKLALRAAEAVGARIAAVDVIRTGTQGALVLEVDTDSCHMLIDRSFKRIPEYRDFFNLDRYIAQAITRKVEPTDVRVMNTPRRR